MKSRTIVWTLWAMVVLYGIVNCQAVDEGERRGGGRKRNRGGSGSGSNPSAFRPEQSSVIGASANGDGRNLPVDPLFTDQREIRLSFMKVKQLIDLILWRHTRVYLGDNELPFRSDCGAPLGRRNHRLLPGRRQLHRLGVTTTRRSHPSLVVVVEARIITLARESLVHPTVVRSPISS